MLAFFRKVTFVFHENEHELLLCVRYMSWEMERHVERQRDEKQLQDYILFLKLSRLRGLRGARVLRAARKTICLETFSELFFLRS